MVRTKQTVRKTAPAAPDYASMKVADLKAELRKKNLPVGGNKDALVKRLLEAARPKNAAASVTPTTAAPEGLDTEEAIRAAKLPALRAEAKRLGLEVKGTAKKPFVDALIERLQADYDAETEDEGADEDPDEPGESLPTEAEVKKMTKSQLVALLKEFPTVEASQLKGTAAELRKLALSFVSDAEDEDDAEDDDYVSSDAEDVDYLSDSEEVDPEGVDERSPGRSPGELDVDETAPDVDDVEDASEEPPLPTIAEMKKLKVPELRQLFIDRLGKTAAELKGMKKADLQAFYAVTLDQTRTAARQQSPPKATGRGKAAAKASAPKGPPAPAGTWSGETIWSVLEGLVDAKTLTAVKKGLAKAPKAAVPSAVPQPLVAIYDPEVGALLTSDGWAIEPKNRLVYGKLEGGVVRPVTVEEAEAGGLPFIGTVPIAGVPQPSPEVVAQMIERTREKFDPLEGTIPSNPVLEGVAEDALVGEDGIEALSELAAYSDDELEIDDGVDDASEERLERVVDEPDDGDDASELDDGEEEVEVRADAPAPAPPAFTRGVVEASPARVAKDLSVLASGQHVGDPSREAGGAHLAELSSAASGQHVGDAIPTTFDRETFAKVVGFQYAPGSNRMDLTSATRNAGLSPEEGQELAMQYRELANRYPDVISQAKATAAPVPRRPPIAVRRGAPSRSNRRRLA